MATPTRDTSAVDLDRWNTAMRASAVYQQFMRSIGNNGSGHVKLSRDQQTALETELARSGITIPSGMHIDQGGNLNQKNRLARNVGIGAAATGAALTGFGLAGMGPLAGLGGAAGGGLAASVGAPAATEAGIFGAAGAPLATTVATGAGVGGAGSVAKKLAAGTGSGLADKGISAAIAGLAGLPGLMANRSTSPQEDALTAQAQRLLQQQEARTQYADPLYKAAIQMAYGLMPRQSGNYPGGG